MKKVLFFLLLLSFFQSCRQTSESPAVPPQHNKTVKYAHLFTIEEYPSYKVLHILEAYPSSPGFTYVLAHNSTLIPDSLQKYPFIQVPVKKWIVTSTTHLPALEMLHAENSLIAFPGTNYISSPVFRKKIDDNQIQEVGFNGQLNPEKLLALQPELLMLFNSGNTQADDNIYTRNGIPVIYNADWLENNPLGRAEWIKVFGLILDKSALADSIFDRIEKKYEQVKAKIKDNQKSPLIFQGGKFGDKWFVPGGDSYAVRLIKDAGGKYIWQEDKHQGSLQLNYENVMMKLSQADIWLNPGMYEKKNQLADELSFVKKIPVFQNDKIYTYNLKKGKTGGVLYFEYSNAHPEWVLDDLFHIFYPQNDDYRFHFYDKLP